MINKYKQLTIDLLEKYNLIEFCNQSIYLRVFVDDCSDIDDLMYYFYCKDKVINDKVRLISYINHQHLFVCKYLDVDYNEYEKCAIKYLRKEKINAIEYKL